MTIINQALENFNNKYNMNLDIDSFAQTISKYASVKKNGKLIADETIAEAIHDYYLHGDNCSRSSYEIVNIIKLRLDGAIWKDVIIAKELIEIKINIVEIVVMQWRKIFTILL